jgi:hypothetical protein
MRPLQAKHSQKTAPTKKAGYGKVPDETVLHEKP